MERAAFLLEDTGQRIPCLLNPGSIVVRRLAGVIARQSSAGPLTGAALKDDPLVYTGGGMTEILLDLLFDVSLAGSTGTAADVRDLTRPLTELAEGKPGDLSLSDLPKQMDVAPETLRFHQVEGAGQIGGGARTTQRLDEIAAAHYGNPAWWRLIAVFNNIDNPSDIPPGTVLNIPPDSALGATT